MHTWIVRYSTSGTGTKAGEPWGRDPGNLEMQVRPGTSGTGLPLANNELNNHSFILSIPVGGPRSCVTIL